ncbi:MAG: extracellular solute-binding protein [Clostridia bacterium]|nr:extracellular solute-binding protein [Clostridia bacterium]
MKRFVCFILLAFLTLSLTSCHGSRESKAFKIPENFDTSRNYEISFWAKNDTNLTQVGIYKQAIADFQEIYPNITVKLKLYTDYGRIYQDVITNISTDTTPNVCITYPDHIATYLTGKDTVAPLDDLMSDEKYGLGGGEVLFDSAKAEEIVPQFLNECEFNGHYYALPYMRSTEACYVNKTYVEKLGFTLPEILTWDFVFEVSEAAMKKDAEGNFAVNGQKVLIPFMYKSTDNMMIQMLEQRGGEYSNVFGEIKIFNDTTKDILKEISVHSESRAFNTYKMNGYPANFLNAGQCIFAVDSTAGATWMGSNAPLLDIPEESLVQFETVVYPIPQYDVDDIKMISQGPSMCIFNKEDPQEVLASWLFMQFMITNKVQISYAQTEGYVPVTSKAQESEEYKDYLSRSGEDNDFYYGIKLDATKLLLDNVDKTFVTPVFNGSVSLRDASGHMIETVNKAVKNDITVNDEYIDKVFADTRSLYRLDQINKSSEKVTLGELPVGSWVLIGLLAFCWISMLIYVGINKIKKKN